MEGQRFAAAVKIQRWARRIRKDTTLIFLAKQRVGTLRGGQRLRPKCFWGHKNGAILLIRLVETIVQSAVPNLAGEKWPLFSLHEEGKTAPVFLA